ncbi:MAG: triple tyrosine motif-containing protein [Bacteroidota bacterium]
MKHVFKLKYQKLWAFIYLMGVALLNAQELPPIQNFSPSDYGGENQNWAISQSGKKLIYVANNKGLLEYNGAKWTLFPSPNETIIRSVTVVGDRIYTGCYKEFGYWIKNEWGTLNYFSLSGKIKEDVLEDEEFWNIVNAEGHILFQSKKRIYIYDLKNETVNIIPAETSLPRIFNIDQTIYFQKINQGLFKIELGEAVVFNEAEPLLSDEVITISKHNDDLLLLTRNSGFYKIVAGALVKWNTDAEDLLLGNSCYSALQLADKSLAIGTIANGVLLLDENGNLRHHIDQINGLRNNTVLSLFEDVDRNLWLGLDNGVSYINLNSPFRVYEDNRGVIGSVYTAVKWGDRLYLGTNQGLFHKKIEGDAQFALIEGTQGQVWYLDSIDGTLFCGHHSGTFVISEDQAQKIATVPGTWKIAKMRSPTPTLLQGNYEGLFVIENKKGSWSVRNKIKGFDYSSRYFEVLDNEIFVNHEYKGVFKVTVDDLFTEALAVQLDSLTPGFNSGIITFQDELLYAHKSGIMKYNSEKKKFEKDSILSQVYAKSGYVSGKMIVDSEANLWLFSKENISKISQGKLANTLIIRDIHFKEDIRNSIVGYESISTLEDGKLLLGTSMGYSILNLNRLAEEEFTVQIGAVYQSSKNQSQDATPWINKNLPGEFESNNNNLGISYYTANYDWHTQPNYQFQLSDIYPNWSDWSDEASVTFENLPYGDYTFSVRSKLGNKVSANVATYVFAINRPWHFSNTAIALYIFLGIVGTFLIHYANRTYYKKRQQKLVEENEREMELAKAHNEREIVKIKNEQLQKEFRSKSNELAASTLSIIRKNELLTKVKEELLSNGKSKDFVNPIIRIIDNNLNKSDDWELFKEAFNNADRKFLKKLKKAHPNLSPNDIRLCAYLRLNLSSKEIAPLLNISARSVEIKRYRLRKKMDLSHDDNLVNYILKL